MGVLDIKVLLVVLTSALSTFDQSGALPANDVNTLSELAPDVTPSPSIPQWTVRDSNNKICMMMAMNATIQISPQVPIPSSAIATAPGSCDDKTAYFNLEWTNNLGYIFTVSILFVVDGKAYKMANISGTERRAFNMHSWSDEDSDYPSAALGSCMTCREFNSGVVYFTEYQFQPFAQQSEEQYGKAKECSFGSGSSFWAFLVLAVIVLVIVAAAVGVVFLVVKKVKTKRGYTQIQ